tara:strand:- start:3553 stop:3864 length:312 start_codon:yes stop_codon:yes gene_type:complete
MKSIRQIFKDNEYLMEEESVKELIQYCQELENEVIETKQVNKFSFEDKLTELVKEIYHSINSVLKEDENAIRFKETNRVDFKFRVELLKEYLINFSKDNKFNL